MKDWKFTLAVSVGAVSGIFAFIMWFAVLPAIGLLWLAGWLS